MARLPFFAISLLAFCAFFWIGCDSGGEQESLAQPSEAIVPLPEAQDTFWNALLAYCGTAYEDTGDQDLVIHFRHCEANEIQIPLHIGDNRSRTWILTRQPEGLRLKHDHRERDGSESERTQYGGDTESAGSATRQRFHADEFTGQLVPHAVDNVWTIEIDPTVPYFAYELTRDGEEVVVRWKFDLSRPIDPPPAPWGYED